MKIKKFGQLKASEIKKINRYVQDRDKADSCLTGYSYSTPDEIGFVTVTCEICSHDMTQREADVIFNACLFDRRKSFVSDCAC